MNKAIILAAGQSRRFHHTKDKLLEKAAGHPVIYYSLIAFAEHPQIDEIVLLANKNNRDEIQKIIKKYKIPKIGKITLGASTRQKSLEKGFNSLKAKAGDVIIVHNGANPLPSFQEISKVIEESQKNGACIVGHTINSTVKEVKGRFIVQTHNREKLFAAETPQAARYDILQKALKEAKKSQKNFTDEAMLLENAGYPVKFIPAHTNNFKITDKSSLNRLKTVLGELPADFRTGIGQDSHRFDPLKKGLTLAGLTFPEYPEFLANSDGDVILHAIFNALSQAIGEKSLGFYADPACDKGVKDSREYLKIMLRKIRKKGFHLSSLGLMLECKTPKIDPLVAELKSSLVQLLRLPVERIGITATSGEDLTSFGRGEGVQCFAIVSLIRQP